MLLAAGLRTSYVPGDRLVIPFPLFGVLAHAVALGLVRRYSSDFGAFIAPLLLLDVVQWFFILTPEGAAGFAGILRLCGLLSKLLPVAFLIILTVVPNQLGWMGYVVPVIVTCTPLNVYVTPFTRFVSVSLA